MNQEPHRLLVSLIAWVVLFVGAPGAQAPATPVFDAVVADAMRTFEVPGMAVAIVKDGKTVLAKGLRRSEAWRAGAS